MRFEGFLGTVQEYEELLDEYAVEDNENENAAGIVHWEIITPADQPVKVRVIISSRKLLERLSTKLHQESSAGASMARTNSTARDTSPFP